LIIGCTLNNMKAIEIIKIHASQFARFLGLQRSTVGLLAMVVLVGMGERMAERFLPIYILALGGGVMAIGLLQAMDNFLSALYSFPGGCLSDRVGTQKALLIFNLVAMCGFAPVILIPTWQAVLIGAVLFVSWSAIYQPATLSLMYKVLPQNKRTMGVSMHSGMRFSAVISRCRQQGKRPVLAEMTLALSVFY
jgi:MFS family permease